jgi:hypothetical protein
MRMGDQEAGPADTGVVNMRGIFFALKRTNQAIPFAKLGTLTASQTRADATRLAGLLPAEQDRIMGLPKTADFKAIINGLSDEVINGIRLDAGCIGLVSCYVMSPTAFRKAWIAALNPNGDLNDFFFTAKFKAINCANIDGAKFYYKYEDAISAKDNGYSLVAIEGAWKGGTQQMPAAADSIVLDTDGAFNFAVYFDPTASKTWGFMDNLARPGRAQTVFLRQESEFSGTEMQAKMFVIIPYR